MPHPGHLGLFNWCRQLACDDAVIVGVNSSEFVARFKTEPRYSTDERVAMVRGLRSVDEVVINTGLDQPSLILAQEPKLLVIGSDWWWPDKNILEQLQIDPAWLERHGIGFAYVPRTGDWSSTEMRARRPE